MRLTMLLFFAIGSMLRLQGQGMEFFHGTWAEALEEAKKQDRIIFVDAFAVWCGPCKMMAQNVFPDEKVGAFYNRNFINLKLDMEKGEGLEFRKTYPVAAFPTLFYIDAEGKVVQQVRGAQDVNGFLELGKKVMAKADRSGQYAAEYEKGNRDPELVLKYVQALNKAGKPSLQISLPESPQPCWYSSCCNNVKRCSADQRIFPRYRLVGSFFEGEGLGVAWVKVRV